MVFNIIILIKILINYIKKIEKTNSFLFYF